MQKYVFIGDGESVHLLKWVKELCKYFDVYIISSRSVCDEIKKIIPENKIFCLKNQLKNADGGNFGILKYTFKVKKIIKNIKPDYVNAHYITSHGMLAAIVKLFYKKRFFLIQSTWGTDILVSPFKNKIYYWATQFILQKADLVTSDSIYMTDVIKKMSTKEVTTFTFGLEKMPEIKDLVKDENLYFSNRGLTSNYNVDKIIIWFSKIVAINPKAKLIISHDGYMRKELEEKSAKLGLTKNIEFKGFISIEEQERIYSKSQFYITIPTSDATSVSLLEAMAYGCIPIVSDIPANKEWIEDKKNGIFFNENNTDFEFVLTRKNEIQNINREIIQQKALFSECIKTFFLPYLQKKR